MDFATAQRRASAVRGVSFYIAGGEVLGLVGESGSGRSITALSLLRLLPAQVVVRGSDEPTTTLDVTVQAEVLDLLAQLREKFSLGMLFISHDLAVVSQVADRISVMYAGSVVETASAAQVFAKPAHPYTRGLLNSVPTLRIDRAKPLRTIEGIVPAAAALPSGCAFELRCSQRVARCSAEPPPLVEIAPGQFVRCPVVAREVR
jgi:oligopeptide/dipeptide ABC transporter ATP-binding protein